MLYSHGMPLKALQVTMFTTAQYLVDLMTPLSRPQLKATHPSQPLRTQSRSQAWHRTVHFTLWYRPWMQRVLNPTHPTKSARRFLCLQMSTKPMTTLIQQARLWSVRPKSTPFMLQAITITSCSNSLRGKITSPWVLLDQVAAIPEFTSTTATKLS